MKKLVLVPEEKFKQLTEGSRTDCTDNPIQPSLIDEALVDTVIKQLIHYVKQSQDTSVQDAPFDRPIHDTHVDPLQWIVLSDSD